MAPAARFASGYYVANAALLASYLLLRRGFAPTDPDAPGRQGRIATRDQLAAWELQCLAALAAIVVFRMWRRRSWDHVIAQGFFYAKAVLACLLYLWDARLAAWYCIAYWVVYVLLPQPMADLTASGSVTELTPTTLREASLATDCAWLVFFYTRPHGTSVAAAPAFLEVADEFASPKLRFGAFDVCLWPGAAGDLRLSSNTWSNVLPSVILFDRAKEWGRLPPPEHANDPRKPNAYRRRDIVRAFKLEERFSRPLELAGAGGSGGSGGRAGAGARRE